MNGRARPTARTSPSTGMKTARLTAVPLEEVEGEQRARRPGLGESIGAHGGPQFADGSLPPRHQLVAIDRRLDGHRGCRGHDTELDAGCRRRPIQNGPKRFDRRTGVSQLRLQPAEVATDQCSTSIGPGRQHGSDVGDRHAQLTQPAHHLGGGNLAGSVVTVAGRRINEVRLHQADLVIVAQRLHTELCHSGAIPDRQAISHRASVKSPVAGESSARVSAIALRSARCQVSRGCCGFVATCACSTFPPWRGRPPTAPTCWPASCSTRG